MSGVTGVDLVDLLATVAAPSDDGFSVLDVPAAPGYKLGRGADGVVALLTPPDAAPEPPTRLRTLHLDPRVRVRIEGEGGISEADHGLVQLSLEDDDVLEAFLGVAATVIRLLGPSPAPGVVSAGMRRLVKIFDPAQPPRGSVLGLWAELLLISRASDPAALVDAWHAHVDARFDFSAEGSRLEVKATTKDVREHVFNLLQLKPVVGSEVVLASVMTTETSAGRSVGALVEELESLLAGDGARQMKVHTQVAETLGHEWARHLGRCFDQAQAVESLLLLDPAEVPQVEDPPDGVVHVSLTVDCSDVPAHPAPTGLATLLGSAQA